MAYYISIANPFQCFDVTNKIVTLIKSNSMPQATSYNIQVSPFSKRSIELKKISGIKRLDLNYTL